MSEVYVPPSGPPQGCAPSRKIFALMGEENLFRMCKDFYAELEQSEIRGMFPEDMVAASEKLACFLAGLFGGPPLYQRRYGNPMMRKRHLPFHIDEQARQVWLSNFMRVLEEAPEKYNFPEEHLPGFKHFLQEFSGWMVNRRSD